MRSNITRVRLQGEHGFLGGDAAWEDESVDERLSGLTFCTILRCTSFAAGASCIRLPQAFLESYVHNLFLYLGFSSFNADYGRTFCTLDEGPNTRLGV